MSRILIVQNSATASEGDIGSALDEAGVGYDVVYALKDPVPVRLLEHDAVIVLGGGQHAADDDLHPYLAREKELLRSAVERGQPCLGICLGAQVLAHAMGAVIHRGARVNFGFQPVRLTEAGTRDPLFSGLPEKQHMFQWHADSFELPSGAESLAYSESGAAHQAFRIGERGYGVQYHVEVDDRLLQAWLGSAADAPPGEAVDAAVVAAARDDVPLHYPAYRRNVRTLIENFLSL
ncbi:type 1 glutamine amidotransferase [Streptomyces sp. NPDC051907]|uniref:type 1 glutamine amidotransferase n=1 Tax=Streptomyces sp. NPDC051907 TaxID=3155284 RepID=UPI0034216E7D